MKNDWPILQLTDQQEAFIGQVVLESLQDLKSQLKKPISYKDVLEKTVYKERGRIKKNPWKVDPEDEAKIWSAYKARLAKFYTSDLSSDELLEKEEALAKQIIGGYAREMIGNFNKQAYQRAIRVVPLFLNRILNGFQGRFLTGFFKKNYRLRDKIRLHGDFELYKSLDQKGTIVLLPTHFTNLDSMLIGFATYLTGLPPFLYGAGLNLFNNKIVGYFIDKLGAYKLDRRKKNPLYLTTLKTFSRVAISRGVHTLFFPGGTRSRTGALENKLKMGLLGTVLEAQRNNYLKTEQTKIFIIPLVVSYHFVLEAPALIRQHLKREGKEKLYLEKSPFGGFRNVTRFLYKFLSKGSDIVLSYGTPIDVFGHQINNKGESIDQNGQIVDIQKYFFDQGKISNDNQREAEYTKMLAEKLIEIYKKENIVLSSHLVAFTAFQIIKKRTKDFDLFNMMKIDEDTTAISYDLFTHKIEQLIDQMQKMSKAKELKLDEIFKYSAEQIIDQGLNNVGLYHSKKVLYKDRLGRINTDNMNTLYFYHNRLSGYNLEIHV